MYSPWQQLLLGPYAEKLKEKIDSARKSVVSEDEASPIYENESVLASLVIQEISTDETQNIISGWIEEQEPLKSAREWKELGNQMFKERKYRESLLCYTKGANATTGEERAVLIGNRSASLFFLEQYADCITDIEEALDHVPVATKERLEVRKQKCTEKLDQHLKSLSVHSAELPDLLKGENKDVVAMSASLKIAFTAEKGRHVVATETVRSGDTLFKEEPYIAVLLSKNSTSYCSFCFRKLVGTTLCCRLCGEAIYCNSNCRKADTTHLFDCGHLSFLYSVGIAHLAWKIITKAGFNKLIEYHDSCKLETASVDDLISSYANKEDPYLSILFLNAHICEMTSGDLAQYSLSAFLLNKYLEMRTSLYAGTESGTFEIISYYFLRHICQMICNAHAITELHEDTASESNVVTEAQERIATAIYPSASLMNHACEPTIINSFSGRTLIVRSVKDVKTGGEIFHCYGPHYARMPTKERKNVLKWQYFFDCSCPYCTDPKLMDLNERFWSFACRFCKGSLRIKDQYKAICKDCNKEPDHSQQCAAEARATQLYQDGIEAFKQNNIDDALVHLAKAYKMREDALYRHHISLADNADWLARVYASVGKYVECLQTLELVLEGLKLRYGPLSIEIGYEMRKRSDILIAALQKQNIEQKVKRKLVKKLKDSLELTVKIFEIHYGAWSDPYKEAKSRLEIFSGFHL